MAVLFQTSFEDYADGVAPNEDTSLIDNGWAAGSPGNPGVVSNNAHTGVKAVYNDTGALQRNTGYLGQNITIEMWAKTITDPPFSGGPSLQVASLIGSSGVTSWPITMIASHGSTDLRLTIFDVIVATAPGVVQFGTYQKFRMEVQLSTVNDAGTDVNADGQVRVYVDDALVISASDVRVAATSVNWPSDQNYWDALYWDVGGYIDDVSVSDDVVEAEIPDNDSDPCCGSTIDPRFETSSGGIPRSLQPWTLNCAGGGVVQTAEDIEDLESWDL